MIGSLQAGMETTEEFEVEGGRLLTDVGGTLAAQVLSTPGMIAMMERTASRLVYPALEDGKATVGFEVNVRHVGAARKGDRCSVHARLEEIVDGRKLRFAVEVTTDDGRTIGVGRHERRVIDVETGTRRMTQPDQAETGPVCIVGGTGALGFGLAVRLGKSGIPIIIGSRDEHRAQEAAERASDVVPQCAGRQNAEAVEGAEIVILSVPFRSQSETLTNLKSVLKPGQLLVDATVPLAAAVSGKATRTLGVWQGSAAQQAQEMAPDGVRVVSAFHTVSAALLTDLDHELDEDVLICGDHREDKAKVSGLVDAVPGLRPVDCGPLEMARIVEQLTPLIISINVRNKVRAGIRITGL